MESLATKQELILDGFTESSEKLQEFASSQFEKYIVIGEKILQSAENIWNESSRIADDINNVDILGDEFVGLTYYNNQNVGNAEVNFIKDSSGQSQKVVM